MTIKVAHLPTYRDIAALLFKYHDVVVAGRDPMSDDTAEGLRTPEAEADAQQLAADLESMGPTFVKFGQLLSTRADILPRAYLDALRRLQDHVEPVGFDDVRGVVEAQLGTRLSKAFATFDERPAAAASLGQVHRAALRDGRPVAVKVQRPGIRGPVQRDMDVLGELAVLVDEHTELGHRFRFASMVEEFRLALMAELDYTTEARNLRLIGANLARFDRIVVPSPVDDYSTSLVLTMDWIEGRNLGSLGPLARSELDGHDLANELFIAYLDQILIDGVFHADPHPGNLLLTDDGRLALVDLGMVGRISLETQDELLKLLLAISQGRGSAAADVIVDLGERLSDFDRDVFRRRVGDAVARNATVSVDQVQAGTLLGEVLQIASAAGVRPPSELTLIGKALLNLDEAGRILDPRFEPNAAIERHAEELLRRKMLQSASPASVLASAMEIKEFTERLPDRVNKVLDAFSEGQLTLNIQGINEGQLMRGVQKLANRVALGVMVAALVIAGALALPTTTHATAGGPVVSIVLFALGGLVAAWLVLGIVRSDLPQHHASARARRDARRREAAY